MASTRTNPRHGGPLFLGMLVLSLVAGRLHARQAAPANAEPSPQEFRFPTDEVLKRLALSNRLEALVGQLGSRVWSVREQAMRTLASGAFSNEQLLAAMRQIQLDSEQQARLLTILGRRILDAPSGAIGIRMNSAIGALDGVQVEAVIEGMPAAGLLKAGDLITEIDGKPVRRSTDLTAIVQSKLPGDLITVILQRMRIDEDGEFLLEDDGRIRRERVEVSFALGSIETLESDGGNVVRSSTVRSTRARLVQELMQRFAPEAVRVTIERTEPPESEITSRSPDEHPSVIWLNSIALSLERGVLEMDPNLRLQIFNRMNALEEEASAVTPPSAQRVWLDRVIERYGEIVGGLNR
ncbi:MAG: PDZ domain-containing protein [Planctomycetota bacterium]|nr:PDZ domain-containing protein [Planctomycetota bacterium]